MPRWLKVLVCTVLILGVLGIIGYHVLEWRAQDSLVVRSASIEREADGRTFINFEFHNRSKFPIRVEGVATLFAADDYGFVFHPPQPKESFLLKAGAQHHYRASLQNLEQSAALTNGFITVDWTPASSGWLSPLVGKLRELGGLGRYMDLITGKSLPLGVRTMEKNFLIHKSAQGHAEKVELKEVSQEWLFTLQRWRRT